jgi:hypothetical protein
MLISWRLISGHLCFFRWWSLLVQGKPDPTCLQMQYVNIGPVNEWASD